ncbi:hypothetical protein QJQ45_025868 [Haematococcus lacustris]|nr:hypothetical protein QJQ45_025868 [Haematococcus lacustris]
MEGKKVVELTMLPGPGAKSTEQRIEITSWTTGVLVFLVAIWALFGHKLRRIHLSEGSAACGLGLVCGLLLLATRHYFVQQAVVTHLLAFSADSFFTFLLPPVIFYAGLSLEKKMFFAYLGPILALGIVGTGIAFLLTAAFLWAGFAGFRLLRLQDCLALGAIFSATDSVATLQVLNADTQPLLFSMLFGEGIINDATSVVLLGTINRLFPATAFTTTPLTHTPPSPTSTADRHPLSNASTPAAVWHGQGSEAHSTSFMGTVGGDMLATFLYLFITSLSLGVVTGLGTSYLVTRFAGKGPHHEVAMIGLLSYLSYLVAEVAQLSGILSLFCCAIIISHLALPNLWVQADVAGASTAIAKALNVPVCWSLAGRSTTLNAFKTLSYISEGTIFIYLGMDALDPNKWESAHVGEALSLCGVLLLLLLLSRAASVIPIITLYNWTAQTKISTTDIFVIWWSGLMRGAVSVALAYSYFDVQITGAHTSAERHRSTLIAATLLTVLITVMILGWLTQPLMQVLVEEPHKSLLDKLRLSVSCFGRKRSSYSQDNSSGPGGSISMQPMHNGTTLATHPLPAPQLAHGAYPSAPSGIGAVVGLGVGTRPALACEGDGTRGDLPPPPAQLAPQHTSSAPLLLCPDQTGVHSTGHPFPLTSSSSAASPNPSRLGVSVRLNRGGGDSSSSSTVATGAPVAAWAGLVNGTRKTLTLAGARSANMHAATSSSVLPPLPASPQAKVSRPVEGLASEGRAGSNREGRRADQGTGAGRLMEQGQAGEGQEVLGRRQPSPPAPSPEELSEHRSWGGWLGSWGWAPHPQSYEPCSSSPEDEEQGRDRLHPHLQRSSQQGVGAAAGGEAGAGGAGAQAKLTGLRLPLRPEPPAASSTPQTHAPEAVVLPEVVVSGVQGQPESDGMRHATQLQGAQQLGVGGLAPEGSQVQAVGGNSIRSAASTSPFTLAASSTASELHATGSPFGVSGEAILLKSAEAHDGQPQAARRGKGEKVASVSEASGGGSRTRSTKARVKGETSGESERRPEVKSRQDAPADCLAPAPGYLHRAIDIVPTGQ